MNTVEPQVLGNLYLIPTRLGHNPHLEVLPISIKKVLGMIDEYIMENEKAGRAFIKKVLPGKSQQVLSIQLINKFTNEMERKDYLNPCLAGRHIGLLSDAGCPGIADPGADIVAMAHEKGIKVVPLVGPSSILLAMMSSGLNGQNFAFNGYLPIDKVERKKAIKALEKLSKETGQSQIFMETPYRNDKLLETLKSTLAPDTFLCVAADITLSTESISTLPISVWKKKVINLHKRPTIFILHRR